MNAAPDGYTILLAGRSITAARYLNASLPFDPLRNKLISNVTPGCH